MSFSLEPNERERICRIYADEIIRRADWVVIAAHEFNQALKSMDLPAREITSLVVLKSTEIVTHAMAIVRIIDPTGSRNCARAGERVELLKEMWPEISVPPDKLRGIRNSLEHFEDRLDEWVETSRSKNYVDLNVGQIAGVDSRDCFRNVDNDVLSFWGKSVSLTEVVNWAREVARHVSS